MPESRTPGSVDGVEISSLLHERTDRVWSVVTRFDGVNAELMPVLRMTAPGEWRHQPIDRARPGQRLFRSWLLLFGVLPIDFDDLCIAELGPGHRFLERSRMMSATLWEHERIVEDVAPGRCLITDRVRFTPRWRPLGPVLRWVVPRLFHHRHRRLRRRFPAVAAPAV